ncbi:hypothetical protein EIN_019460 [Entamoeba invadens IP1]|uniref:hypothetical protein n=1 Tax=Entamoeba invadens IP1 TaxID=370355 RepID=UPI0002C3DD8D|nr:hypothetical protein EIN_019460 [Entamoeba invadens IP1]ELP90547.1 hypothetical protein EIN_019460 [Entamoeba invadens IP1]|eukprot:XP_004257318.1 hypothetical protein EIN_019460 [Entamoeba invadens IP1]
MSKKRVDTRLKTLIENGVSTGQRTLITVVGSKASQQVMNLYYMMTKAMNTPKERILWCYKKDLGFSTNAKRRVRDKGKNAEEFSGNAFELFLSTTDIRYVFYNETHKILGNTFGMVVLQDFEAMTPNIMARTIETVKGGGIILVLLSGMTSIKQLYKLNMDINDRYRDESTDLVSSRFNERFVLSLSDNLCSVVISDELDVLPIFEHSLKIDKVEGKVEIRQELLDIRNSFSQIQYLNEIVKTTVTADQAKCVVKLFDCLKEKTLNSTISITAGRGRGKSAALGLTIACSVALGYSNIFVTSPSPENVKTVFEFAVKGLEIFGMKEHLDFDLVQTQRSEFGKSVVRINIHQDHRQTVQYILPTDTAMLAQAEILMVDEAAAIPLPIVKKLLGNYIVILSTTTNGYEGTGRSLSLKLIKELREGTTKYSNGRKFFEYALDEPIRYASGDQVEKWLNHLLCLDASNTLLHVTTTPPPEQCELFYVNRDTLFSYNKDAEKFLQQLVGLFVTSHYKNTPNDLQLLADSPNHCIFVLTGPVGDDGELPDILAAVQLAFEGKIARKKVSKSWCHGKKEAGDLIPWTLTQQFLDDEFAGLTGARVVRICTHPDVTSMGYGSKILQMLNLYFTGMIVSLGDMEEETPEQDTKEKSVDVRKHLGPLLINPGNRKPEVLDYLGVAFGYTPQLAKFWGNAEYTPVYFRQTANDITGEHSCIMVKQLSKTFGEWSSEYSNDFRVRFSKLLGFEFKSVNATDALKLVVPNLKTLPESMKERGDINFGVRDIKRIEYYSKNMIDYHIIIDMLPAIANAFVMGCDFGFSVTQQVILIGMGLQYKNVDQVAEDLNIPTNQVMGLFNKVMRKVLDFLNKKAKQASKEKKETKEKKEAKNEKKKKADNAMEEESDEEKGEQESAGNPKMEEEKSKSDDESEKVKEEVAKKKHQEDKVDTAEKEILRERAMKLKELGVSGDDFVINDNVYELKDIEQLKGRIPTSVSVEKHKGEFKGSIKFPQKPKSGKNEKSRKDKPKKKFTRSKN